MKRNNKNFYAVIMAGGVGTRLWPLSRQKKPKQFHKLTSQRTMIQETYKRLADIFPKNNIYISTSKSYRKIIREQLPSVKNSHLITEPVSRNTAPAIGLAASYISKINPGAVVATVASDHAIKNVDEFSFSLRVGLEAVDKDKRKLVTVGINPTYPDTGLGYIQKGKEFCQIEGREIFYAKNFKEKPDLKTAKNYLKNGNYFWNAGYFIFSASDLMEVYKKLIPRTYNYLKKISSLQDEKKTGNREEKISRIFSSISGEAFDTAIVEKLKPNQRLIVPSKLIWSDVGNWAALFDFLQNGKQENHGKLKENHISCQSRNCFVQPGKKLIATIGLENIIVIDTSDAILIARKDKVQEVKKIIEELKKRGRSGKMLT